ncbi:sulfoxide reductase catalytic subunit YedY [Micromonospora purpureochromogenes]|uniref:Sulfoxide reductase catalytic subunit YedY n=1 Tax=Micromonospora purpureochromogenes TaxID=47872 RepID=A0A1C5A253_9ACTN|nr:sulfite oxidase [Micromonospora purpureochromogenes]SCF39280.1 sulfoxide reductase catalytic subunit YedY [Micromonospora purpureochromogenes]
MTSVDDVSRPSRVAGPDEAISAEELQLAARNHGIPLEALRYDVTPAGLHYLLIHYDIPDVDPAGHALTVDGAVRLPLILGLDELRSRPRVTRQVTLECAGNGRALLHPRPVSQPWLVEAVGNAEWTGTPLAPLLREAGIAPEAVDVVFTGADHGVERGVEQDYQRALPVADALRDEVLLAYEMNGAPLLPQHGAPLRLIVPGWYGMAHVKWLRGITVLTEEFDGYQNAVAYRLRRDADDPGEPVTRIEPRALVRPPGFPDFMTRTRVLRPGPCTVDGRAWSGHAPITSVEVTTDGGATWAAAIVDPPRGGDWSWRRWRYEWSPRPGRYVLGARATDASGRTQPVEQPWNRGGFANNLVQRVEVAVLAG